LSTRETSVTPAGGVSSSVTTTVVSFSSFEVPDAFAIPERVVVSTPEIGTDPVPSPAPWPVVVGP
jgi:hypothetical protein